jgi:hypothetical protein
MISETIQIAPARGLRYTPWWYMGDARLANRVALVTGAGRAVGQAISIAFAREGADILLSFAAPSLQEALETSSWIERAGRRAVLSPFVANTEERCAEMVRLAVQCFGRIDIVANTEEVLEPPRFLARDGDESGTSRTAELLFDACIAHMSAGGAVTDTFCAPDGVLQGDGIYEAQAAISVLAQSGLGHSVRVNGVCVGTPEQYRDLSADEHSAFPHYLADIATAHVLCASDPDLNSSIIAF